MKNQTRTIRILPVLTVLACAFLSFGVMAIFHSCGPAEDGEWMSCHYAQLAVFVFGLVMTALALTAVFLEQRLARILYIAVMVCAVISAVIPQNVIHLCMMPEMRCRAVMRPAVILLDVLILALSAASLFSGESRESRRPDNT